MYDPASNPSIDTSRDFKAAGDRKGDNAAVLESIFFNHETDLNIFLNGRVRTPDERDEVRQSVFERLSNVAANERLGRVRNPAAFIVQIAKNILIDRARARKSGEQAMESYANGLVNGDATNEITPERVLLAREKLDALKKIVDGLPAKRKRIFLLNRIEGLPVSEIARLEGMSEPAVSNNIRRALVDCQNRMYEHFDAPLAESSAERGEND